MPPPYDVELEQAVLGTLIVTPALIEQLRPILDPPSFYDPLHQRLYGAMQAISAEGGGVTPLTINAALSGDPGLKEVGGVGYLAGLAGAAPAMPDLRGHARLLIDLAVRRGIIRAAEDMIERAHHGGLETPVVHQLHGAEQEIETARRLWERTSGARAVRDGADVGSESLAQAEHHLQHGTAARHLIPTGLMKLDDRIGGFAGGDLVLVAGRPGQGKAQPYSAKILKPDGSWTTMGRLRVGTRIASTDGMPSIVTGVFERGIRAVYRITLSDGRSTEACAEHLWRVNHRHWRTPRILSTEQIATMLTRKRYGKRLSIDSVNGEFGIKTMLPIDPYVLGCLIGDGSLGPCPTLTTADESILAEVSSRLGLFAKISRSGRYGYRIASVATVGMRGRKRNGWLPLALESLGLAGHRSEKKFVPQKYLRAPRASRLLLLQGLMDTDGWAEKDSQVLFSSSSEQLAKDVQYLVRSLGGLCKITPKQGAYRKCGVRIETRMQYVCRIRHPHAEMFFRLPRKVERARRTRNFTVSFSISSVVPIRNAKVRCISVSHPSRLYVTDEFIVTHNSSILELHARAAAAGGFPCLVFSKEMMARQWIERTLCDIDFSQRGRTEQPIYYSKFRNATLSNLEIGRLAEANRYLADLPLEICDADDLSMADIVGRSRAFRAKHNATLGLIVVDYLQIIDPPPDGPRGRSREQEVATLARGLKSLAKRLQWPVVAGAQLSRQTERRDEADRRPSLADLRESGALEQEADIVLAPYRKAYYIRRRKPEDPAELPEWHAELREWENRFEYLGLKYRHGSDFGLDDLFCNMGASAIRDEKPNDFNTQPDLSGLTT